MSSPSARSTPSARTSCLPLSHDEVVHGKGSLLVEDAGRRLAEVRQPAPPARLPCGRSRGKKLLFMGGGARRSGASGTTTSSSTGTSSRWPPHAGIHRLVTDLNRVYAREPALHERDCRARRLRMGRRRDDAEQRAGVLPRRGRRRHGRGCVQLSRRCRATTTASACPSAGAGARCSTPTPSRTAARASATSAASRRRRRGGATLARPRVSARSPAAARRGAARPMPERESGDARAGDREALGLRPRALLPAARGEPVARRIEPQPSAAPYHDWNERITAECYRPNAAARILDGDGRHHRRSSTTTSG